MKWNLQTVLHAVPYTRDFGIDGGVGGGLIVADCAVAACGCGEGTDRAAESVLSFCLTGRSCRVFVFRLGLKYVRIVDAVKGWDRLQSSNALWSSTLLAYILCSDRMTGRRR